MKKTLTIFAALLFLGSSLTVFGEDVRKASFVLVEFYPAKLQSMVPIEAIFVIKNTGNAPINPYAEVTLSGRVVTLKGDEVLRIVDKKYYVHNLWPGETTGKQRLYIGSVPSGEYTLELTVNAYNKVRGQNLSTEMVSFSLKIS